jgi:hypothetical protein
MKTPSAPLTDERYLGMDQRYAEVSLWRCAACGQIWLRYQYEMEAFSESGQWFLGAITAAEADGLTAECAKETLERLEWYYFGGSYFRGGRGRASGNIALP